MSMKKITFEFPVDAWDGIVASLTEWNYQETVPNPKYDGTDQTIPPMIDNPLSREDAATQAIKDFVADRYKSWAERTSLAPVQQQIQAQVQARAIEVDAATKVIVE